jgi:tetratricopeptide (TPR) repeat protein
MTILVRIAAGAALLSAMSVPAHADERNGYRQIVAGDYASAERIVNDTRKLFPVEPDLLLNLAAVYRRTGRVDDARALYQRVLGRPDADLDLANGANVSAHALARAGLRDLGQGTVAPR